MQIKLENQDFPHLIKTLVLEGNLSYDQLFALQNSQLLFILYLFGQVTRESREAELETFLKSDCLLGFWMGVEGWVLAMPLFILKKKLKKRGHHDKAGPPYTGRLARWLPTSSSSMMDYPH